MTSRQPFWCSKAIKRRPCWCAKLDLFYYVNTFFSLLYHYWGEEYRSLYRGSLHRGSAACFFSLKYMYISGVYCTFKIFWERLISINEHYNVNTSSVGLVKIRWWNRVTQKEKRSIRSIIGEREMKRPWRQTTLLISGKPLSSEKSTIISPK